MRYYRFNPLFIGALAEALAGGTAPDTYAVVSIPFSSGHWLKQVKEEEKEKDRV